MEEECILCKEKFLKKGKGYSRLSVDAKCGEESTASALKVTLNVEVTPGR
jgi:hypothetical protein